MPTLVADGRNAGNFALAFARAARLTKKQGCAMKSLWIALMVCAAPTAQSQSPVWSLQPEATQPSQQLPPAPRFNLQAIPQRNPTVVLSGNRAWNDASIDPKIIRRPDPGTFAQHAPRTPIAQNLYPSLKLLPVETASIEPIPRTCPELKVQPVPRAWPDFQFQQIHPAQKPATPSRLK